jgi:hypothetical protein
MRRNFNGAIVATMIAAATIAPAFARGNDIVIKDGFGENVVIKHGFFGHDTKIIKDRLGDGYAEKKGWFGTKEQDVNVLGNSFQRHKGLLGGTDIKGSTIFGDKIETKKGIFGRRTTCIDVSGGANALRTLWNQNKSKLLGNSATPNNNAPLGTSGGLGIQDGATGSSAIQSNPAGADTGSPGQTGTP